MNVNAMYRTPATSAPTLILRLLIAGAGAALMAGVLASRVPEPVIIVGVIVTASLIGWHRIQLVPARVRSQHRFTVVSRCGDGFVTIDSSGARHVARRLVLGSPTS
jgi:hypothetical protein